MRNITDSLWDKIEELNAKHKETVLAIYAIINEIDSTPHTHVGNAIKARRKERKMTQDEAALKIGCSRNYFAQVEKMVCLNSVSFGIVVGIAAVFDMSLYELVTPAPPADSG